MITLRKTACKLFSLAAVCKYGSKTGQATITASDVENLRCHEKKPTAGPTHIRGHMLSAAVAYQVFRQENPQGIDKVKAMLDKHPWYANQWQARLQDVPAADRDLVLFMQAATWSDDLRNQDRVTIDRLGSTLTCPSNQRGNQPTCKSENPSQ